MCSFQACYVLDKPGLPEFRLYKDERTYYLNPGNFPMNVTYTEVSPRRHFMCGLNMFWNHWWQVLKGACYILKLQRLIFGRLIAELFSKDFSHSPVHSVSGEGCT